MWVTLLDHHMKEAPLGFVGICDPVPRLQTFPAVGPILITDRVFAE